jgi:hypothetical protein
MTRPHRDVGSLIEESLIAGMGSSMVKGMLLKALSRDDDRIAQVGRIARHDPDGTRHVLADGDKDVILYSFLT